MDLRARRPAGRRHHTGCSLVAYSPDRKGEHPQTHLAHFKGILQADAYAGFNALYEEAPSSWAHARRKFYDLHETRPSPLTTEALRRIGELYVIEAAIRGKPPNERVQVRQAQARPLLDDLERRLHASLAKLSRKSDTAAIQYASNLWPGRWCATVMTAASKSIIRPLSVRCVAIGRRNYLFAGADSGGERAAAMYSLIGTAKLNGVESETWLRHVLANIADHPVTQVEDFLPWNCASALASPN